MAEQAVPQCQQPAWRGWREVDFVAMQGIAPACRMNDLGLLWFWEQGDKLNFFFLQNHWFTYNETMTVESVTQAVSNLALQFGEEDADPGAMVRSWGGAVDSPLTLSLALPNLLALFCCSLVHLVLRCFLEELMRRDPSCKFVSLNPGQVWEETKPLLKLPRTL